MERPMNALTVAPHIHGKEILISMLKIEFRKLTLKNICMMSNGIYAILTNIPQIATIEKIWFLAYIGSKIHSRVTMERTCSMYKQGFCFLSVLSVFLGSPGSSVGRSSTKPRLSTPYTNTNSLYSLNFDDLSDTFCLSSLLLSVPAVTFLLLFKLTFLFPPIILYLCTPKNCMVYKFIHKKRMNEFVSCNISARNSKNVTFSVFSIVGSPLNKIISISAFS